MFRRIDDSGAARVTFTFEGREISAHVGDTVAAALLANGARVFRTTPVSGAERGPFCMMGACYDCMVEIDGVPHVQACLVRVMDGMNVDRQRGIMDDAE